MTETPFPRPSGRTEWFRKAGWGVCCHYLADAPSQSTRVNLTADDWNRQVDTVDVEGLAEQLASAGASYMIFTVGQNSGFWCAPNQTYDRLVGITPSRYAPRHPSVTSGRIFL